jgi:hypothetical protein
VSDNLVNFFKAHPFWAILIIIFMILPIIGAVGHIILKALGRKGIDNTPPANESPDVDKDDDISANEDQTPLDSNK